MTSAKRHLENLTIETSDEMVVKKLCLTSRKAPLLIEQLPPHVLCKIAKKFTAKTLGRFHRTSHSAHKFVKENHTDIFIPVLLVIDEVSALVGPGVEDIIEQSGLPILSDRSGYKIRGIRVEAFSDETAPDEFNRTTSNILANVADFPDSHIYFIWKDQNRPSCQPVIGAPAPIDFIQKLAKINFINGALFEGGMLQWWNQYETDEEREGAVLRGVRCWELIGKYKEAKLWWSAQEGIGLFRMLLVEWANCLDMGRAQFVSIAIKQTTLDFKEIISNVFHGIDMLEKEVGLIKDFLPEDELAWMEREDDESCNCELRRDPCRHPPSVLLFEIRNKNMETATVAIADSICGVWLGFVLNSENEGNYFKILSGIPGFNNFAANNSGYYSDDSEADFFDGPGNIHPKNERETCDGMNHEEDTMADVENP